jgi:hypothetical protein
LNLLTRIVTPAFITWQAHMWSAYAVVYTFYSPWVIGGAALAAGIKEFYVDKHFEVDQSFRDNATDFAGYFVGIVLAIAARTYL